MNYYHILNIPVNFSQRLIMIDLESRGGIFDRQSAQTYVGEIDTIRRATVYHGYLEEDVTERHNEPYMLRISVAVFSLHWVLNVMVNPLGAGRYCSVPPTIQTMGYTEKTQRSTDIF